MKLRNLFAIGAVAVSLVMPVHASDAKTGLDMDALLTLVKEGQARDNAEFNARMKRFNIAKYDQETLLNNEKKERTRLENESAEKSCNESSHE